MSYIWEQLLFGLILIGILASFVFCIFGFVRMIVLDNSPCPDYHCSFWQVPDYCDHCGECLRPSCSCGHEWQKDQQYCPDCGLKR